MNATRSAAARTMALPLCAALLLLALGGCTSTIATAIKTVTSQYQTGYWNYEHIEGPMWATCDALRAIHTYISSLSL